jgi:glycosyltransferase involved in cell wall biosynthesis
VDKTLVSIIVPIYNVESYLEDCLQSIANQTYVNFEVILVNDGSTDNSNSIALNYANKDSRFKLFSKENGGLSSARNFGLEQANGDYVYFIDSDDTVKPEFLEKLFNKAIKLNADFAFCLTSVYSEEKTDFIKDKYYNTTPINPIFFDKSFDHLHIRDSLFALQVSAWNKIYKTSFLQKIKVKFPEGLCFEDNPFFFKCILNAERIAIVNEELYIYRADRPGSILTGKTRKFFDFFKIINIVEEEIKKSPNLWFLYRKNFVHYKYSSLLYWLDNIENNLRSEFYTKIQKELRTEYPLVIKNVYGSRFRKKIKFLSWANYIFYYLRFKPFHFFK